MLFWTTFFTRTGHFACILVSEGILPYNDAIRGEFLFISDEKKIKELLTFLCSPSWSLINADRTFIFFATVFSEMTSMKKSLVEQIFTALLNQPKMVLIEIFWKFMKFRFFSMKHPHTIAFEHKLGKKYSHIDFFTTICLILYCFVYKICLIKLNLHEKWAQLTKFFYGFVNVTSSAIQ